MTPPRTLVLWCPDWPVAAAGVDADTPAAVFHANRVVACSAAARADGVRRGMRRREAQGRCPELLVLQHDEGRDARGFEPVVAAVESFTPGVEVLRPGACAIATRGPSRYFGGDEALCAKVVAAVTECVPGVACQAGVADGTFAATLAARVPTVVAPGDTSVFLAPYPVGRLDDLDPDLRDLLRRLGIRTLGHLAALPPADVVARFGLPGAHAHRLARGDDERLLAARTPPPDLTVALELDPPAERLDAIAFAAKTLADDLGARLSADGLACTRIRIEAETEHGEAMARVWRHHGPLTATAMAERVRWQLDGWLNGPVGDRPSAGLSLLRLVPEEVGGDSGRQHGFWGSETAADERAARALARVQGMLGPDAVLTAVLVGGRDPASRVRYVPWGDPRDHDPMAAAPWPGHVPDPAPALVHPNPLPAEVLGADGAPVVVTGRATVTEAPVSMAVGGRRAVPVMAWTGPWPADERWWDPPAHRRRARFQLVTPSGAHLVVVEGGQWTVEASYS